MHPVLRVLVALSFAAVVSAPRAASAQPGERPATSLFVGPTGRVLPKGQGSFKAVAISVPILQGGVTDRFSMGIGVPLIAIGHGVLITPKFQVYKSSNNATSVGSVAFIGEYNGGLVYLAHTVEGQGGAVHVAAIKPIQALANPRAIGVMVGAEGRVSDRVLFMTENYIFGGGAPLLSGGVRIKMPHTTLDVGWLVPTGFVGGPRPIGLPMFNWGYKF